MSLNAVEMQRDHYDRIAGQYHDHYGDFYSRQYRLRFIDEPLFEGMELEGKNVLEAMCGAGHTTEYLLSRGAHVTGLDISNEEMTLFRQCWPECDGICASILDSGLPDNYFDCVAVIGGLHHLHPNLEEALQEIYRILRPGGYLCFAEPHKGSLPDLVRAYWYKHDRLFAHNEASIDLRVLKNRFSNYFNFGMESYLGNIAYLLVLNSMVFRVPLKLKRLYSPTLMKVESAFNRIQGQSLSCFVISQWQKK
jgi:SAM-dependent methyltransferase